VNTGIADTFDYCSAYVRRADEDRWLAVQYAPRAPRARLLALYALHLEIAEVPAKVTEPALGEIRLQWWREALAEIQSEKGVRAHPVLFAAKAAGIVNASLRAELESAIAARAQRLYAEPFTQLDDLVAWMRAAEGYVAVAAARLISTEPHAHESFADAAVAFALARDGAALAPRLAEAARVRARELLTASAAALGRLSSLVAPGALHFTLARAYLASRAAPLSPISKRWSLFLAMATGRI
jgi:phytoene synthase